MANRSVREVLKQQGKLFRIGSGADWRTMGKFENITDSEFRKAVEDNFCIRDVVGSLGYSRSSGSMAIFVKERIRKMKLDTSHFLGRKSKPGGTPRYDLSEILVKDSKYENIDRLKRRILKEKLIEYKCEKCGNAGEWQGKELVLQLGHKNGKHNDHRLENLCFLCPNCHSQTSTYSGKNIGKYS